MVTSRLSLSRNQADISHVEAMPLADFPVSIAEFQSTLPVRGTTMAVVLQS